MKNTIFILLTFLISFVSFAQRKTTNVKGYYRKNGTYVSSHTRSYNSGKSSINTNYIQHYKETKDDENKIQATTLNFAELSKSDYKNSTSKYNYYTNSESISSSKLNLSNDDRLSLSDSIKKASNTEGVIFFVSVLRYNNKTIDICPITRGILGDWEFNRISHSFDKNLIPPEDALELVSNYGWEIKENRLSKNYSYSYRDKGLPKLFIKTIEAIKVY